MPYGKGKVEQGNLIYLFTKLELNLHLKKKVLANTFNILTWPL